MYGGLPVKKLHEDKLAPIKINLGETPEEKLDESFLRMFGASMKIILQRILGDDIYIPLKIKGDPGEIQSFARTLNREKRYMQSYVKNGLNDSTTYELKYKLDKAVQEFEKSTNLKWPFK